LRRSLEPFSFQWHKSGVNEDQLITALKGQDPGAVQELVNAYGDRLLRSAFALCGNEADAQDIVQDTAAIGGTSENLPHAVRYELGDAEFAPGDNITIQQVRGTRDTIATGGTYSDGLINAIQLAARNAGVALRKVAIDDPEYPFLVGVICGESDFPKLKDQIKKMDGYAYNGGTGSHTCYAFSIIPYKAYPPEASQRIHHRLMLRTQVFYEKLSAQK
jgi:hypothetical protein